MKQNNYLLNLLKVTIFSFLLIATSPVRAEIKVVTTIKPLHSLIANVMDGVGEPSLIIEGSTSPHSFTLKPSHAKLLEEADLIFWVGEGIETFMERPLESIVKNAEVVEFMEVDSIEKLKFREQNIFCRPFCFNRRRCFRFSPNSSRKRKKTKQKSQIRDLWRAWRRSS